MNRHANAGTGIESIDMLTSPMIVTESDYPHVVRNFRKLVRERATNFARLKRPRSAATVEP